MKILASNYDNEYAIYLYNTDEWIQETNDERVWLKTDCRCKRFTTSSYSDVCKVLRYIAKDKNLKPYEDIKVVNIITRVEETILGDE